MGYIKAWHLDLHTSLISEGLLYHVNECQSKITATLPANYVQSLCQQDSCSNNYACIYNKRALWEIFTNRQNNMWNSFALKNVKVICQ